MTPARSQIVGQSLEATLNFAHSLYANRERVWVRHNEIRGRFRSRGGGQAEFTPSPAKGAPDYYGCIDGRMVAFDAKSTGNKSQWTLERRRFHQYLDLVDISEAGGVSWFAIEHRPAELLYLMRAERHVDSETGAVILGVLPSLKFDRPVGDVLSVRYEDGFYDWLKVVRASWLGGPA